MKMISRILLLLILSSCLCATFVVNVTQSSYQAEENHSITLEWTFTSEPDSCLKFNFIIFTLITDDKLSVLFHEHDGVEVPMSQDEQFAGRVQSERDVLPEGRTRLHVSRLRTEDSGLYVCEIKTDHNFGSAAAELVVFAAPEPLQVQRLRLNPQTENRSRLSLCVILALIAAAAAAATAVLLIQRRKRTGQKSSFNNPVSIT
ncbi:uncharacterized protein LOC116733000 isoform X2 [Xiphophorus hellerii]|uniref:uncharacterized protein LOC116733000 isoform X2 n=1 Tax=Xiphophorus hellerii TaxID=8084 RepID=UPI0013B42E59|nr:uncharacterized protein LOC116733000 isoform X2 [Xiphophorus hellerii]